MNSLPQLFKIIKTIGLDMKDDIHTDINDSMSDIKNVFTQPLELFKNEELDEANKEAGILLNNEASCLEIIPKITENIKYSYSPLNISEGLWEDSGLEEWTSKSTYTKGGANLLWNIIKNPTSDVLLLQKRQECIKHVNIHVTDIQTHLDIIKRTEIDVLWLFTLPDLKDAYPINLLFPSMQGIKLINNVPIALDLFQFYRSSILPWISIAFPLSTFLGPWWYMRKTLGINMSIKKYCKLVYNGLKFAVKPNGSLLKNSIAYFSLFMYVFFYIYGILQGFQTSQMLRKMQQILSKKLDNIRSFVNSSLIILKNYVNPAYLNYFDYDLTLPDLNTQLIPVGMCGLYKLMKDNKTKDLLKPLCISSWIIDSCVSINNNINNKQCCFAKYIIGDTKLFNMGHITLKNAQIKNPANLSKSLIITGPNAAGKTTYVRSILTNIILSQSIGIVCASSAYICPVHALGTFMRISDVLGTSSLFEAEVKRCSELIKQAEQIAVEGKRALYFLDEPMHSTPPIEGSATSKAVIEYIAKIPGVHILVTTHYHDLVTMTPKLFRNISMDAIEQEDGSYKFPYKLQNGPSFKCIALELLEANKLPRIIVDEAIKIKNNYIKGLA